MNKVEQAQVALGRTCCEKRFARSGVRLALLGCRMLYVDGIFGCLDTRLRHTTIFMKRVLRDNWQYSLPHTKTHTHSVCVLCEAAPVLREDSEEYRAN